MLQHDSQGGSWTHNHWILCRKLVMWLVSLLKSLQASGTFLTSLGPNHCSEKMSSDMVIFWTGPNSWKRSSSSAVSPVHTWLSTSQHCPPLTSFTHRLLIWLMFSFSSKSVPHILRHKNFSTLTITYPCEFDNRKCGGQRYRTVHSF